jgi:hypothetical protein
MTQPFDYIHKSGNSGLVIQNYATRVSVTGANPASVPNQLLAQPFFTGDLPLVLAEMGVNCTSTGTANVKMAIYDCLATRNIYPRNLLHDLGAITLAATGPRMAASVITLAAGKLFWLVTNTDGGTGGYSGLTPSNTAFNAPVGVLGLHITGSTTASNELAMGLTVARSFGASPVFPAIFPAGAVTVGGSTHAPAIILSP